MAGFAPNALRAASSRQHRKGAVALATLAAAAVLGCHNVSFVPAPSPSRVQPLPGLIPNDAAAPLVGSVVTLMAPAAALAKGGQWGPFEGKASSLVHPFVEACLFLLTLYTGFLGWQWRRTRLMAGDISEIRTKLKAEQAASAKKATDEKKVPVSAAEKALQAELDAMSAERTELAQGKFKDRHYAVSSVLLGGGVFFTFYGTFNTFFRAEKLFPGPHLYAGAAIVVLWALGAALVPAMEKGNETARNAHIALATANVGLFCWQLPTGWEILGKVWNNANLQWFPAFAEAAAKA